jgi:hypothetical protein
MAKSIYRLTKRHLHTLILTAGVTVAIFALRFTSFAGLGRALTVFINPLAQLVCIPMQKIGIPHARGMSQLFISFAFWFVVVLALRSRFERAMCDDYGRNQEARD